MRTVGASARKKSDPAAHLYDIPVFESRVFDLLRSCHVTEVMTERSVVTKVFWPEQYTSSGAGLLIGWNIRKFTACIAAVTSVGSAEQLEEALEVIAYDRALSPLHSHCGGPPVVLGEWRSIRGELRRHILHYKQNATIWLTMDLDKTTVLPYLKEIHCCGCRYRTATQVVLHKQPSGMTYLALENLDLDTKLATNLDEDVSDMEYTLRQINSSKEINAAVEVALDAVGDVNSDVTDKSTANKRQILRELSQKCYTDRRRWGWRMIQVIVTIVTEPLVWCAGGLRVLADLWIWFLNLDVFPGLGGGKVKEWTMSGQQVDIRLREIFSWPTHALILKRQWKKDSSTRANYVKFYSSIWVVVFDCALGVFLGAVLRRYAPTVLGYMHIAVESATSSLIQNWVVWLMEIPAGLKLNSNLTSFFGVSLLMVTDIWKEIINLVERYEVELLMNGSYIGIFGASLLVAVTMDIFALLTAHLFWFYCVFSRIYGGLLTTLAALFKLFHGKKRNVLRNRIDSCHYDLDQLLMGTLWFTVLFFLFPTVWMYYSFFVGVRIVVLGLQVSLSLLLALVNHFPLFAIIIHVLDPARLPGGVYFEVQYEVDRSTENTEPRSNTKGSASSVPLASPPVEHDASGRIRSPTISPRAPTSSHGTYGAKRSVSRSVTTYVTMHVRNLPFRSLFFQLSNLLSQLVSQFSRAPADIIRGRRLASTPHLRYPANPLQLSSTLNFWLLVKVWRDSVVERVVTNRSWPAVWSRRSQWMGVD